MPGVPRCTTVSNDAQKIAIIDTRKTDQKDKEGKKTEKMTTVGKKSDVDIM